MRVYRKACLGIGVVQYIVLALALLLILLATVDFHSELLVN